MTRLIGLDLETTGLDQAKGHRIIEIAMITYDLESQKQIDAFTTRVDPERAIDPEAQSVHGISYGELVGSPKWGEIAEDIERRLNEGDFLIAHNVDFDVPFVVGELIRVGGEVPSIVPFCTKENARWATPDGKFPRLSELCFALGNHYDLQKAHGAVYDTQIMMDCFFKGYNRGFFKLPLIEKSV